MTMSLLHKAFPGGGTIADYLETFPQWLADIGIGFDTMVRTGYNRIGLTKAEMVEFLRLCIFELYRIGARPATSPSDRPAWYITDEYGTTPDAIANKMIGEWLAEGAQRQVDWGRWWFSWPDRLP